MIEFQIGDRMIGRDHPPMIIAEMSGNHNNNLDRALALADAAAEAGAHALKLQTYTPDTITLNERGGLFDIKDQDSLWHGKNLYELYKEAHTPWDWHEIIFERAKKRGMLAFSSPFDETAVEFLQQLDVPAFKIASFESNHFPLLKKVAQTGKPVLISSGTSNLSELVESVRYLQSHGADKIVIFKCTSTYPALPENSNLNTIPVLQSIFPGCIIGLSDHTMGVGAATASIALGARVIEKHFTLSRADGGVDSAFSLEPQELLNLVIETEKAFQALGTVQLESQKAEEKSRQFKRSIYASENIKAGDLFSPENIKVVRPGDGLHPKYYESLLGTKAQFNYEKGRPIYLFK